MKKKTKKRKKKLGRPKGKRNRFQKGISAPWLVEVRLKCKYCKRIFLIKTNRKNIEDLYTKEVKTEWECRLCDTK